jgi:hypothetical protein
MIFQYFTPIFHYFLIKIIKKNFSIFFIHSLLLRIKFYYFLSNFFNNFFFNKNFLYWFFSPNLYLFFFTKFINFFSLFHPLLFIFLKFYITLINKFSFFFFFFFFKNFFYYLLLCSIFLNQ